MATIHLILTDTDCGDVLTEITTEGADETTPAGTILDLIVQQIRTLADERPRLIH